MSKADFEKSVQQKMQELRFQPSQDVWKRVEADITPKRRRRPMVLWFLFAGLLMGAGSIYFISTQSSNNVANNHPQHPGQAIAEKQEVKTESPQKTNEQANESISVPVHKNKSVPTAEDAPAQGSKHSLVKSAHKPQLLPLEPKKNYQNESLISADDAAYHLTGSTETSGRVIRTSIPIPQNHDFVINTIALNDIAIAQFDNNLPVSIPDAGSVTKTPSQVKKTNWQFGITATGGMSDLGEQLLQTASSANLAFDPQLSTGGSVARPKPSDVQKGASYSFGAFVNKTVGKKWKLGLGLGYQYFSNTIKVGEKVDSVALVNQNNFALDRVSGYYKSSGNNPYHNQYHFIGVPVNVQWQFAKRFTWENSLIVSRMMKTNALHYDGITGRYYEDDDLFNKYQLSASTALLFAFHKNKIQVGPQLQYAFTNLMKESAGNPKHLRAISIKANVELWKN